MPHGDPWAPNRMRQLWSEDRCAFGVIATMPSPQAIQVLAHSGLDFVIIDMEHGPIGPEAAHAMIAATAGSPLVPLVRVRRAETSQAKLPLDLGARGICFPFVASAADARRVSQAVRYPPRGRRAWGPFYAPASWGADAEVYKRHANDDILAIATVEHPSAVDEIDLIARSPDLDLAFIGHSDLATAMGQDPAAPAVAKVVARLEASLAKGPVKLGGVATQPGEAPAMIARGYRALVLGFDGSWLAAGAARALEAARTA